MEFFLQMNLLKGLSVTKSSEFLENLVKIQVSPGPKPDFDIQRTKFW